jgi:hypothetical protein
MGRGRGNGADRLTETLFHGARPIMIDFSCTCGKQLRSQDAYAGEVVTCPQCGAKSVVP